MVILDNNSRREKYRKCIHLFLKCNRLHHALIESKVSALGLHRSQHTMLLTINHIGNISQKELAQSMEISPAAVAVTLKKLGAQGYIERRSSSSDSRVNNITITEKGREIIEKTTKIFDEVDEQTFRGFTEEKLERLYEALNQLSQDLQSVHKSLREKSEHVCGHRIASENGD